jgi:hypothetical protein
VPVQVPVEQESVSPTAGVPESAGAPVFAGLIAEERRSFTSATTGTAGSTPAVTVTGVASAAVAAPL